MECQYVPSFTLGLFSIIYLCLPPLHRQTRKKCTFDEQPRERKKPAAKRPSAALESHSEDQTFDSYQTRASTSDVSLSERPVAKRQKTEAEFTGRKDNSLELSIAETAGLRYHVITSVLTDDLLPSALFLLLVDFAGANAFSYSGKSGRWTAGRIHSANISG